MNNNLKTRLLQNTIIEEMKVLINQMIKLAGNTNPEIVRQFNYISAKHDALELTLAYIQSK